MLLAPTLLLPFLVCSNLVEARSNMRSPPSKDAGLEALQVKHIGADKAHISPELEPASSQKFFKKDYPYDQRPGADIFHFKHPYPVVQDSGDYDADYVKDENSDNGSWQAQEDYDRIRHKLAKQRKDLARALARKTDEENQMKDAMRRHAKEAQDRADAEGKARRVAQENEAAKRRHQQQQDEEARAEEERRRMDAGAGAIDKAPVPAAHRAGAKDVDVSTKDTEKAMKNLEDCKKELAAARDRLKKLMKELEEAKTAQNAADQALDGAMKNEVSSKEYHSTLKKQVNSQYKDYMAAKADYEKAKAKVDKLGVQIKAAAAKVKAIRDSEDNSGGVYQTPEERSHRSAAQASRMLSLLVPLMGVTWLCWA